MCVYLCLLCVYVSICACVSEIAVSSALIPSDTTPLGAEDDHETMRIMPIGAGNEVGRSCIILKYMGKTIMLDCGIHPVSAIRIPVYLCTLVIPRWYCAPCQMTTPALRWDPEPSRESTVLCRRA